MSTRIIPLSLSTVAIMSIILGCGGGGGGGNAGTTGRAVVIVNWPGRSDSVPTAANSIKATFIQHGIVVASEIIIRPQTTTQSKVMFDNLPIGTCSLVLIAYPNLDGTGIAQATGTMSAMIVTGQTTELTISTTSTIYKLEITPIDPILSAGQNEALSVTAKDSDGNTVLTWPANIRWDTADHNYATVDSSGKITAVKPTGITPGSILVIVTELDSGKSASVNLIITSQVKVTISPSSAVVSENDKRTFSATVTNAADTSVNWSIVEGDIGGSISADGVYHSPETTGTFHIVATSVFDNSKSDTIPVTITDTPPAPPTGWFSFTK